MRNASRGESLAEGHRVLTTAPRSLRVQHLGASLAPRNSLHRWLSRLLHDDSGFPASARSPSCHCAVQGSAAASRALRWW